MQLRELVACHAPGLSVLCARKRRSPPTPHCGLQNISAPPPRSGWACRPSTISSARRMKYRRRSNAFSRSRRRSSSLIFRHAAIREYIDDALIDGVVDRLGGRGDAEECDQGACGAAVGRHHRVAVERRMPGADAAGDILVGLAAGRPEQPLVMLARFDDLAVAREDVL